MNSSYSKDIPTPPDVAARKANVTKAMIVLKKQLNSLRGTDVEGSPVVQRPPVAVP